MAVGWASYRGTADSGSKGHRGGVAGRRGGGRWGGRRQAEREAVRGAGERTRVAVAVGIGGIHGEGECRSGGRGGRRRGQGKKGRRTTGLGEASGAAQRACRSSQRRRLRVVQLD